MSLINQVLKDLERRHAGGAENPNLARAVRPPPRGRSHRSLWVAVAVCIVSVMGAGVWWFEFRASAPVSTTGGGNVTPAGSPGRVSASSNQPPANSGIPPAQAPALASPGMPAPIALRPPPTSHAAGNPPAPAEALAPAMPANGGVAGKASALPNAATTQVPAAVPTFPAQEAGLAAAQSKSAGAEDASKLTAKAARKAKRKPGEAANSQGQQPAGTSEYPEPEGVQAEPNIQKQVRAPSERERAETELRLGLIALQGDNVPDAEDHLHRALAIDPLTDKATQALLGLYVQRGRREDAERLLDERLRIDSKHVAFSMALARLQLERGGNGEALITLQRSAPYGESSADYQAMFANTLSRVGRHKEAAERYQLATRLAPQSALWYMGLGMELKADDRPLEARAALERARDLGGLNSQLASYIDQQIRDLHN